MCACAAGVKLSPLASVYTYICIYVAQNSGLSADLLQYMLPNFELSATLAEKNASLAIKISSQSFEWPAFSVLNSDSAHDISAHNLFGGVAVLSQAKTRQDKVSAGCMYSRNTH